MLGDSDFFKAVRMESPDVIPTSVSILPAMWIHRGAETERLVKPFRSFFLKITMWTTETPLPWPMVLTGLVSM